MTALYRDALNSKLDPAGLADWGSQLALMQVTNPNIISDPNAYNVRESVALSVLTSEGGYQNLVTAGYQTLLRRQPDAGAAYWINQLLANTITEARGPVSFPRKTSRRLSANFCVERKRRRNRTGNLHGRISSPTTSAHAAPGPRDGLPPDRH